MILVALVFIAFSCPANGRPQEDGGLVTDAVLNDDAKPYHSHPSAVAAADGEMWIAWHAYDAGRDRLDVRRIAADGTPGPIQTIGRETDIAGPPVVVADIGNSVWVIWSALRDGRWRVLGRKWENGSWRPARTVSDPETDAIFPTAALTTDGRLVVAWSSKRQRGLRIVSRVRDRQRWGDPVVLSSPRWDAYRPAIAAGREGEVWAFWDQYEDGGYTVQGQRLLPTPGRSEQVSPPDAYCLKPTALATKFGMYVAWLRKQDVIGGPGVISQWHTLQAAVRDGDRWKLISDEHGNSSAAELTQGLMAKIDPTPIATGGYLGRRTQPMLLDDGEAVWLLWERKSDHRGSTPDVVGDLIGRPLREAQWRRPLVLHQGLIDYHLVHPQVTSDGKFIAVASQLPRSTRRIYRRLLIDLSMGREFHQDAWGGWRGVRLPIESELTGRRQIRVDDKTYRLFWADLHCHSGLTADAEGEPDELTHYARDRARLDVVVFTNNDFLYDVPLTGYEYALGNYFAGIYTRPRFLSLPGYEWTSRVPGVRTASIADPGNWTKPYRNRSYPNHRSVIYPPSGGPLIRYPEVANDIAQLNEAVRKAGGVTLTQHDAFQTSGHEVEVAMELTSGWRNYIARVPELFHDPLNRGARLGFVACGDSHRRAPGLSGALTGIFAEELTAEAILDALRKRRCFATNGARIFIDARANGALMGQQTQASDASIELTLHTEGTRPIRSVVLLRDGVAIKKFSGNGNRSLSVSFRDTSLANGMHWYYWRVVQDRDAPVLPGNLMSAHGHLAWSSPLWVQVE